MFNIKSILYLFFPFLIKDEIVDISLNVAQKLISKNLSPEDNKKLIKDSLDQVGNYEA